MQYTTFYWEKLTAMTAPVTTWEIRQINCASLYSQIRNGYDTKIYIKEINFACEQFDASANIGRDLTNLCSMVLLETLDNPRASNNLTMTAVNPNDETNKE